MLRNLHRRKKKTIFFISDVIVKQKKEKLSANHYSYRVLAYVKGTLNQGLSYHDPGVRKRNKQSGWVDSDFASDMDTRKSVTGYLMVLNGGPVSWKASRQGGGYVEQ